MSLSLQTDFSKLQRLAGRLNGLGNLDRLVLLNQLAAVGESQTRKRITSDQEAPDGSPWKDWTADYAKTRKSGKFFLMGEGHLLDSIVSAADYNSAEWGSNLVYAAIQQAGGTPEMAPGPAAIPAREYLGLSQDNIDEMEFVVDDWLNTKLGQL